MISSLSILSRLILLGFAALALGCKLCAGQTEQIEQADLFRWHCAELAGEAEKNGSMAVAGSDGWLFLAGELRHLGAGQFWGEAASRVSRSAKPENADPLPAILDFNDQLKKIGVELIFVPVPPKAVIYPDMLPGFTNKNETARLDHIDAEFYTLLRSKGVKVLDLTDFFLQNKKHPQGALYCRQDSHWSGNGCVLAAEKIVAAMRPLPGHNDRQTNLFKSSWRTVEINGDLWQAFKNKDIIHEKLSVRNISETVAGGSIEPDAGSRVILLGDSHNLVFHAGEDMLTMGAGLPDQLAFELGLPVDLVAVRGSGATPARINLMRRSQQRKDYWKNKQCVIWCFSAREFTESDGWSKAPISALNQNFFEMFDGGHEIRSDIAIRWFNKLAKPDIKTAKQLSR